MPIKIGGRLIDGPKKKLIVLPRDDGDIPLWFVSINDESEFTQMCSQPEAPRMWKKSEGHIQNFDDKNYLAKLAEWQQMKADWYFLKSIAPSQIEWQRVKLDDPRTYKLWQDELKEAGFSKAEINTILNAFAETNAISDEMLKEAKNRFLAEQAAAQLEERMSLLTEPPLTESGGPANDSASSHQK